MALFHGSVHSVDETVVSGHFKTKVAPYQHLDFLALERRKIRNYRMKKNEFR